MSQPKCISDHSNKRKSVMALGAVSKFLTLSRITSPNVELIHCVQLIHRVTVTEVCPIDRNATVSDVDRDVHIFDLQYGRLYARLMCTGGGNVVNISICSDSL